MKFLPEVCLFVLLCFPTKGEIFPQGKQWKYSYYGLVRTGSVLPHEAYSQWNLRALLTISTVDGFVIAQLSNFNSSLYNGPRESLPEFLRPTPISEDANTLGLPFIINYSGTEVDSIGVNNNDPLWSVNIKRAVASSLQLNLQKLNTPASLISENNLYGSCHGIEYSVVNNTEFVYVRKVIDHLKCDGFPAHIWSSAPTFNCQGRTTAPEDPITASTTREYTLARGEDSFELKHVMSNRRFYVQPFQAHGEAQQSYQYQVYQLLETNSDPKNIQTPSNLVNVSLTYVQNISDLTHGRSLKLKQKNVLQAIETLLEEVVINLDEKNLDENIVQFHRELMFLYYDMFLLNRESLEILYGNISIGTSYQQETKRNIFIELLPQVGSEVSVNFLKDLIVKRDLKDLMTIKLLSMFPFYVKQYSTKLLTDTEILLTLSNNYEKNIRHTAILSFATLVYQTYQAGKCSLETLENYAIRYFNSFSESTSYEKRMLYLQGLDNLQLGSVVQFLTSVVQNNEQSRHIRFLAAWTAIQSAPQRPIEVYEIYWPILTDRTQHLEMRVTALTMLLIAQPTRSRLLTLFWFMQAETDPHLYHFFYTTLISLQKTQYPCFEHLGKLASTVIRFIRPPPHKQQWMTGNYILDYSDTDRAFGGILQLFLIGNPVSNSPNVVYFAVNNYATQKNLNQMSVYFKLQGVADHFQDVVDQNVLDEKNFEKLIKLLEESNVKLISPEEIHVEMIIKIQGKTVFCYYIDGKTFRQFGNEMKNIKMLLEYHVNYQSIVVPYTREYIEPSDLGTLVIRAIVSNSIASTRGNFLTKSNSSIHTNNFAVDFRYYTYALSFLEIYNPISDMWHGVEKGKKFQTRFLFNGTLNIDLNKSVVELTEVRDRNEYINILMHSQSYVYLVSNGTKALQYHCPQCDNIYNISAGPKKEKMYLVDMPFENFGNKFQISVFDCDSYQEIKNTFFDIFASHYSNSQILPMMKPFLYAMHFSDYISYIPFHTSCGVSLNVKPLYKEETELKLTLILPQSSVIISSNRSEKGTKFISVLTLTQQKLPEGPILQFWNATLLCYWKPIKRFLNVSLTVEHEDSNKEKKKLCVNSEIQFPEIQADMFSIKPSKSTTANFNAVWGKSEITLDSCPKNGAVIEAIASASVSDEQTQIALTSETWPYKTCRMLSVGQKFTPINLSCYLASKESATYRKYTSEVKFSNMPDWFISTAQKLQSLVGLIQKYSSQNDQLKKSAQVTNLKIAIEFSATEPEVAVKWNTKEAVIHYSGLEFLNNFLLNTRFLIHDDWNINLGLNKVCVITSKHIRTVDNRTIPIDDLKTKSKHTIATADCSQYPKFAIFLDENLEFQNMSFSVYASENILTVKPVEKNITILFNGVSITEEIDIQQNINVWRLEDDVILIKTKFNEIGVDIYYTREYMVITMPGFYTGKICGVCSPLKTIS